MRKLFTTVCCSLLLLAAIPASADEWNKKTTITFGQPVEVPGMVLPAGTYVFKLANSESDRHIVLIYNADETQLIKIVLTINNARLDPAEKSTLTFSERRQDAPEALRAWFYPGDLWGQEFVYPRARAQAIAEAANVPVLSAAVEPAETPGALMAEPVETITPETQAVETAELTPVETPAAVAETPAPAPVEPVAEAAAPAPAEALPQTGSSLPLIGLLGAGSLALGGLLRLRSARSRKEAR